MFRVETFRDKFLTCLICQCFYDDPATLHCGHTYCRKCLTSFVISRPDAVRDMVIPCSMRCAGTRVPHPHRPVETWASQIKPSFTIINIMEEFKQTTDSDCSRCKSNTPAIKWCSTCQKALCQRCLSKHRRDGSKRLHCLMDMPQRVEATRRHYEQCEDHMDESVKLICEDCNKPICNTCCSLYHRKCMSVVLLDTKLDQIQAELPQHKTNLEAIIGDHMFNIAKYQSHVEQLERIKIDTHSEIRKTFKTIFETLKKKESTLIESVENPIKTEILGIQKTISSAQASLKSYEQRFNLLEQVEKSDSVMDMYDMYQSYLSSEASGWGTENTPPAHSYITDVKYELNINHLTERIGVLDFGRLDVRHGENGVKLDLFKSPKLVSILQLPDDKKSPFLTDVIVLTAHGVQTAVVTDISNCCIWSISITMKDRLSIAGEPCSLTLVKGNQVMVAVPESLQIAILEVNPVLVPVSTIKTKRSYVSLTALGECSMAAGSKASRCVDILSMKGQVMKSISTQDNLNLFSYPWYMCVNIDGNLLVSDYGEECVTCLTPEGYVKWRYQPQPNDIQWDQRGIQCTSQGVLLADRHANKLIQLTKSGEYVRDVLTSEDGFSNPLGIYVDKNNSLYVSCDNEVKQFGFNMA